MPREKPQSGEKIQRLSALQQIKAARGGTEKRSSQIKEQNDKIYDEVEESEFAARVAKNRQKESFVVDDGNKKTPILIN
jgi:hypothetical protein